VLALMSSHPEVMSCSVHAINSMFVIAYRWLAVTEDHAGLTACETTCLSLRAAVLSSSHSNARSGIAELQHRLSDSQGVWWHWLLPMGVSE